jgi:uncharacterized protein YebE (UPF0316 family)
MENEFCLMIVGFVNSDVFIFIVLPLLIFLARVCDVSLGTIRIILVSRGAKFIAPVLGFFEIMIWLIAIGKVMQNMDNWLCYIAYAGGFATGNYVGICIEERLAVGMFIIRVISGTDATELIQSLRQEGYGVTSQVADGSSGKVNVLYSVIQRSEIQKVVSMVQKYNPKAFYSIEDVRAVSEGVFPYRKTLLQRGIEYLPKLRRKGK